MWPPTAPATDELILAPTPRPNELEGGSGMGVLWECGSEVVAGSKTLAASEVVSPGMGLEGFRGGGGGGGGGRAGGGVAWKMGGSALTR